MKLPTLTPEEIDDISREEDLVDVARVARRIPERKLYAWLVVLGVALAIPCAWLAPATAEMLGKAVRELAGTMFTFAAGILGILLAGFSILTTIAMSDLVVFLAKFKHEKSGLSFLKYTGATFMKVFIPFLIFIAVYVLIAIFGWQGGPATGVAGWLARSFNFDAWRLGATLMLGVLAGFFVHMLIVLQTFVFNVYSTFMFMARGKIEITAADSGQASGGARVEEAREKPAAKKSAPPPVSRSVADPDDEDEDDIAGRSSQASFRP